MRSKLLRAVGAVTTAYGIAVAARPALLTRPSGLVDAAGRTAPETALAVRPLALRDAVSGAALLFAPSGAALRLAAAVRIGADFGDALLLGRMLPGAGRRAAAVAVSAGWGLLSVAGLLLDEPVAG